MPFRTPDSWSCMLPLAAALLLLLTAPSCTDQNNAAMAAFDNGEYETAMDLWMPLAEEGDAQAQFGVAYLYEKGLGVPEDTVEAVHWYRLAAEQDHASSQLNLGTIYQEGREGVPLDFGRAADWYRLAAEQGNPRAQFYLGRLYYLGAGLPRNYDLSFEWLQKAADQDLTEAINHLGILYSRGVGVEQDARRGFELILQAAERGHPSAQLNVTTQYLRGNGTERDFVEALKWHTIFESHERPGAGLPMGWVDREMTEEQVEEAKRRAAEWLAAHP